MCLIVAMSREAKGAGRPWPVKVRGRMGGLRVRRNGAAFGQRTPRATRKSVYRESVPFMWSVVQSRRNS